MPAKEKTMNDSQTAKAGNSLPPTLGSASVPDWVAEEIKATWQAARDAGGEMQAFRIIERMADRLGYGRMENNPSLVPNAESGDRLVRLWVVVEDDRGMGPTACSLHASEEDANKHCSGHKFADAVDVPWSVLESLKPNPEGEARCARQGERVT